MRRTSKPRRTKAKPTITLCMIVRNESPVIERCLRSVLPYIDSWVICDTGSTDDTPELIARILQKIPGKLHHTKWVNFGHNRSELLRLAKGAGDYLLTLDADWTLEVDGKLPALTADASLIRFAGDLDFALPTLLRGDRDWRYEGAAHEYLTTDGVFTREVLSGVRFINHSDGADSHRRIERNRQLLEQDLQRDPDNLRTILYLGLSYRDLGMTDKALEYLSKRVVHEGWDEEVFYCLYQIGKLQLATKPAEGIATLLMAWQRRPQRIEPLVCLANYHRVRGEYHLAALYAEKAHGAPYPDDILFVERDAWAWRAAFELSIALWYAGDQARSLELSKQLLASADLPESIEPYVRRNSELKL